MSDSSRPHGPQHARPPCPSPTPRAYTNLCPLNWWWHPTISSSVFLFSSCPQSFPNESVICWCALTRRTFVDKVLSLLFNMLPRLVIVSPSICHLSAMTWWGQILVFWMLSFKPTFSFSSFTYIKRLFSSSSLSAIRVVSSAYLTLLIFLQAILIPACASYSPAFLMMYSARQHIKKQIDYFADKSPSSQSWGFSSSHVWMWDLDHK